MKRQPPAVLWVGLIALGAYSVALVLIGLTARHPPLLLAGVVNFILLWGLRAGQRWAYILMLLCCLLALLVGLARGAATGLLGLVMNGLVFVPVLLSTRYFWDQGEVADDGTPRFCTRCGKDLVGQHVNECPRCGAAFNAAGGSQSDAADPSGAES